jgi:uncharacterized protein
LANNPAWELFLVATIESFGYNWATGLDKINIVSLGTGNGILKEDAYKITQNRTYKWASKIPDLFMVDALETNMAILSTVGKNLAYPLCEKEMQKPLNSQYGFYDDFKSIKENDKLFSFSRHNVNLSKDYLLKIGYDLGDIPEKNISALDSYGYMDKLLEIGESYAENSINPNQLK